MLSRMYLQKEIYKRLTSCPLAPKAPQEFANRRASQKRKFLSCDTYTLNKSKNLPKRQNRSITPSQFQSMKKKEKSILRFFETTLTLTFFTKFTNIFFFFLEKNLYISCKIDKTII